MDWVTAAAASLDKLPATKTAGRWRFRESHRRTAKGYQSWPKAAEAVKEVSPMSEKDRALHSRLDSLPSAVATFFVEVRLCLEFAFRKSCAPSSPSSPWHENGFDALQPYTLGR